MGILLSTGLVFAAQIANTQEASVLIVEALNQDFDNVTPGTNVDALRTSSQPDALYLPSQVEALWPFEAAYLDGVIVQYDFEGAVADYCADISTKMVSTTLSDEYLGKMVVILLWQHRTGIQKEAYTPASMDILYRWNNDDTATMSRSVDALTGCLDV